MSRRQDPIVRVLAYFEEASLDAAQIALALAKAIVRKRTPATASKKTRRRTRKDAERPAAPPSTPPPMPDVVQPGQPRARLVGRRGKGKAQAAAGAQPANTGAGGLSLPGLGPSTVGE